ncbi:uncharacterized protein LOC115449579 [Manduca sexta]|uniref:uncharacterized protein LOC115449579 n=1 Tax=Manduca sexta TaxID=7130 RepID=UPI00189085BA|nr:uncharacterized protein LOC115449579 [Manduca sexta]
MLLDEMFSIKQLQNRNIKHNSKAPILPRITVQTPTLEVKQKWPLIELLAGINSKTNNNEKNNTSSTLQFMQNIQRNVKENRTIHKVVELRSIPEDLKHQEPLHNIPVRYCTCMKSNAFTTCSHRENEKMCTHTPKYDFRHEPGILTPYPAFYLPYQSYILSATTGYPYKMTYYHPNIINELKVSKKKKHRYSTTIQYDDDLYYENSYNEAKNKYYDYLENDKHSDKVFHKPKKGEGLINIDYDVSNKKSKKPEQGTVKKDPDLHDIINDLDPVYSDCAMKKCYCSSSVKHNFSFFYAISCITFAVSRR